MVVWMHWSMSGLLQKILQWPVQLHNHSVCCAWMGYMQSISQETLIEGIVRWDVMAAGTSDSAPNTIKTGFRFE